MLKSDFGKNFTFGKNFAFKNRGTEQNYKLFGRIKVKVLIFLSIITALILTTQIVFAASLATDGGKLSQIEQEIRMLEQENTTLKVKIANVSSLKTLSQKAEKLGFKEASAIPTP